MALGPRLSLTLTALSAGFFALAGCEAEDRQAPVREGAPVAASTPSVAPGSGAVIDRGVCPFECCVYGRWTTSVETTVYANEGDTTRVAFVLPAREEITGLTGNVHLDPPGLAIARTDLVLAEQDTAGPMRLADGDTVQVLSSLGEGSYRISRDGRIVEAPAFWNLSQTDAGDSDGELMRESDSRWWAQVERDNGDRGWIDMEAVNGIIWGVDACGGPVPDAKGEG